MSPDRDIEQVLDELRRLFASTDWENQADVRRAAHEAERLMKQHDITIVEGEEHFWNNLGLAPIVSPN